MSLRGSSCPSALGNPSVWEINLLELLHQVAVKRYSRLSGEIRWALNTDEICGLVELSYYLFQEWHPTGPLDAWNHTARLLGTPELPDD
jgi:hypothetical protein